MSKVKENRLNKPEEGKFFFKEIISWKKPTPLKIIYIYIYLRPHDLGRSNKLYNYIATSTHVLFFADLK